MPICYINAYATRPLTVTTSAVNLGILGHIHQYLPMVPCETFVPLCDALKPSTLQTSIICRWHCAYETLSYPFIPKLCLTNYWATQTPAADGLLCKLNAKFLEFDS